VPFTTRWENIAAPSPRPDAGYLNLETERFVIHGARVYYDLKQLTGGFFNVVITSRWDKFLSIAAKKHRSTKLAFYLADRYWQPPTSVNVISGVKGPWYFTKRVPEYWFRKREGERSTLLVSMTSHIEKRNAEHFKKLEPKGNPFPKIIAALQSRKVPYRLFGRSCPHGWCYDQVAYDRMTHLLHIKPWGSGSDWAVLKACAKGIPCVAYKRFVVDTMHADILDPNGALLITWPVAQSSEWVGQLGKLNGEANRQRLRAIYDKSIPEKQVETLLRRFK
jgi:hypothetical protein